jgi:cholesterol transport system auxiliary component
MTRLLSYSRLFVIALVLSGCSGGLGSLFAPPEAKTYDLTAPQDFKISKSRLHGLQLVVPEPVALRWLDSDHIVIKPNDAEINYLGEAQWSDRLPRLLQARLIETLEHSGHFRAVSRPGSGLDPDDMMLVEIRNFEVIAGEHPEAYINLSVKFVPARSGRSVAQHVFEKRGPVAGVDAPNATQGLNSTLGGVLKDIAQWAATRSF